MTDLELDMIHGVTNVCFDRRGYVVLLFLRGSGLNAGESVRAYNSSDGPMTTLTEETDHADWVAQVEIVVSLTKRPVMQSSSDVDYWRATLNWREKRYANG